MRKYSWVLIVILVISVSGCAGGLIPKIQVHKVPKQSEAKYQVNQYTKTTPKAVVYGDKVVVVEATETSYQMSVAQKPFVKSFAQRIGGWISSLGVISILLLIVGLFLFPGVTIAFLFKIMVRWKNAFKQTVVAINDVNATKANVDFKNALSNRQSTETKTIINKLKNEV